MKIYIVKTLVEDGNGSASCSTKLCKSMNEAEEFRKSEMINYLEDYDYDEEEIEELIVHFETHKKWGTYLGSSDKYITIEIEEQEI